MSELGVCCEHCGNDLAKVKRSPFGIVCSANVSQSVEQQDLPLCLPDELAVNPRRKAKQLSSDVWVTVLVRSIAYAKHRRRHEYKYRQTAAKKPSEATKDPFKSLPEELKYMIMEYLSPNEIAIWNKASHSFSGLPSRIFRRFVLEEFPWLWEAKILSPRQTDWYRLYLSVKFHWSSLKQFRRRERPWRLTKLFC